MERVCIGIGSNVGDRATTIGRAVTALRETDGVTVVAESPLAETAPLGGPEGQGPFLNAAVVVETSLEPMALLEVLQEIERRLGRTRTGRWEGRTIDLDLLLFGNRVVANARLHVPHLRLRRRRFVLEPLATVAPEAIDPITGRTVRELLEACHD
jgi:2-amino-4-hydroxy-6-hydroxymethyldihydropteridine diphosphokinase